MNMIMRNTHKQTCLHLHNAPQKAIMFVFDMFSNNSDFLGGSQVSVFRKRNTFFINFSQYQRADMRIERTFYHFLSSVTFSHLESLSSANCNSLMILFFPFLTLVQFNSFIGMTKIQYEITNNADSNKHTHK